MDELEALLMPSQEQLESLELCPPDYDKDIHDFYKHTYIGECVSFVIASIPEREPLRLAYVHLYEPRRIETPRWIDAWESMDTDEDFTPILIDLDPIELTMQKLSVYRPRPVGNEDGTTLYSMRWSTIHAQSGIFDADVEVQLSDSEDENDDL